MELQTPVHHPLVASEGDRSYKLQSVTPSLQTRGIGVANYSLLPLRCKQEGNGTY